MNEIQKERLSRIWKYPTALLAGFLFGCMILLIAHQATIFIIS